MNLKTLILGLIVILVTFTLFVGLPAALPEADSAGCEKLIHGCGRNYVPDSTSQNTMSTLPRIFATAIWDQKSPPGIREYDGTGKIKVTTQKSNDSIAVSGYLFYGSSVSPLQGSGDNYTVWTDTLPRRSIGIQLIVFQDDGAEKSQEYESKTDLNGLFSLDILLDSNVQCYRINAVYWGENFLPDTARPNGVVYSPCMAVYLSCPEEEKTGSSSWWIYLIAGMALIGLGLLVYRLLRHGKEKNVKTEHQLPVPEELYEPEPVMKKEAKEAEVGGDFSQIIIRFSGIEGDLANVWSVDEPLNTTVVVKDENELPVTGKECTLDWGDGNIERKETDAEGVIETQKIYIKRDAYTIRVSTGGSRTKRNISSWRKIRIVDYREEMVRLFGEMLETLDLENTEIGSDMTPREVEQLLVEKLDGISRRSIRRVVEGFEEANYSTHPVNRESYVRMYRTSREIMYK